MKLGVVYLGTTNRVLRDLSWDPGTGRGVARVTSSGGLWDLS